MKFTSLMATALMMLLTTSLMAQKFSPPSNSYSHKKTAYVNLENGKSKEGTIKDLDWKKAQIDEISLKGADGKKIKIEPDQIVDMYLPPSGFDKLSNSMGFLKDATQWDNVDMDKDIIGKGHVYFVKTDVIQKKKTRTLLMQLLNPSFSGNMKVFYDPFAKETMGLSVGGIQVAGGLDKSYYVKKGNKPAFLIEKKTYKDDFKTMFGDCPELTKKFGGDIQWSDLEAHVFFYAKNCKK